MSDQVNRKLAAVMFTDIVGYTAKVQVDEANALGMVERHRKILHEETANVSGEVVEFYGDGSLSIYNSVLDAVRCATAMQKQYNSYPVVPVRIGIHLGDIAMKDGSIFGDGVNVSSRVQDKGYPGAIMVSERIANELRNHREFTTLSVGNHVLKNVEKPMELFYVDHPGVVVPEKKHWPKVQNTKGRKGLKFGVLAIGLAILAAVASQYVLPLKKKSAQSLDEIVLADRLAVPPFENFTTMTDLSVLSNMSAHWITKGLSESSDANVVSYDSIERLTEEGDIANAGAINLIKGNYSLAGMNQDSLLFSALLMNRKSGSVIYTFEDVICDKDQPLIGISELANIIKGYWTSRDEVLSPPKYDAYESYLNAQELWSTDDEKTEQLLLEAIRLDPSFYDAHFRLLDYYNNEGEFVKEAQLISELKTDLNNMSDRQKNMVLYHEADVNGQLQRAYLLFMKEFEEDPEDLFNNTSAMILSKNYVNRPEQSIDHFKLIPLESLELDLCSYCLDRIYSALLAYGEAGDKDEAANLAERFLPYAVDRGHYSALIKIYARLNRPEEVTKIINIASDRVQRHQYLYYIAGQEFILQEDESSASLFLDMAEASYGSEPSRTLGRIKILKKEYEEALSIFENILDQDYERNLSYLGYCQGKLGLNDEAQSTLNKLTALQSSIGTRGDFDYYSARVSLGKGDINQALNLLQTAYNSGKAFMPFVSYNDDPTLLELFSHPTYQRILQPKID